MTTRDIAHMWTKDELKQVVELWDKISAKDLCIKLNVKYQQLTYIVKEMRKAGLILNKKHINGHVQSLIKEMMSEGSYRTK